LTCPKSQKSSLLASNHIFRTRFNEI
jgi:hypothetical protein